MSSHGLKLQAHAKINWTLEVLGKRSDGYHDVRTILQTIDLADTITLRPTDEISLSITGDAAELAGEPVERNLAYRAARLLRGESKRGVRVKLEKRVPIAVGLGGGSSDAAAVLRGLQRLWQLEMSDEDLPDIAAELGSDVPFFLRGGTAIASGRGEQIELLPDVAGQRLIVGSPSPLAPLPLAGEGNVRGEANSKTARMYAAVRSERHTNGSQTDQVAARLRRKEPVRDVDVYNVFESVLGEVDAEGAERFEQARSLGTPHLCGSGPAFFFLATSDEHAAALTDGLRGLGLEVAEAHTIAAAGTLALVELS